MADLTDLQAAGTTKIVGASSTGLETNPLAVDSNGNLTVNVTGTVPLPTGAATETTLSSLNTKVPSQGQAAMAASMPVVIASNQSAVPVTATQSGTWNVTNISGTVSLPTGAATASNQTNGTQQSQITDGTTGPVAVKASSTAPTVTDKALVVVLSPNQVAIPTTTTPASSTPTLSFGDIALAAITTAAVRRTTYTEQSVNFQGSIVSSSASDTAAGTGARTVKISYVDQTGVTAGTETVTLNGTTNVNLVTTTKCFIEKIEVITVGSTGSNVGTITLRSGLAGGGTIIGTIGATDNTTFWAHHYVVAGKTCNVTGILMGSNVTNTAGSCIGFLRAQVLPIANQVEKQISDGITVAGLDSSVFRAYGSQITVVGPARVTLYVTTATGSAFNYRGSFDAYNA